MEMDSKLYKKHLEKELMPDIERIMNRNDWTFVQDSAPSHHSNLLQDFLPETLNKRFIKHNEWPPTSPDCSPLDYHFWDKIKLKVYGDRFNKAFENENELKKKIRKVWHEMPNPNDLSETQMALKQFVPRLSVVRQKDGQCIKMLFA